MTLSALGRMSDVNNTDTIRGVVNRLPLFLKTKWADVAYRILCRTGFEPEFHDLVDFIQDRADVASSTWGREVLPKV